MGPNPTDRAKNGSKQHLLVDGDGGPLAAVVAAANVNDHTLLRQTIEAIVVERPEPTPERPQHLCLGAAYDNAPTRKVAAEERYTPHIRPAKQPAAPPRKRRGAKARRWVVERTHSWMNRYRGILIRWNKKAKNYIALLHMAFAFIIYRRLGLSG